jgi:glutamate mutase epsilon subunit
MGACLPCLINAKRCRVCRRFHQVERDGCCGKERHLPTRKRIEAQYKTIYERRRFTEEVGQLPSPICLTCSNACHKGYAATFEKKCNDGSVDVYACTRCRCGKCMPPRRRKQQVVRNVKVGQELIAPPIEEVHYCSCRRCMEQARNGSEEERVQLLR